MDDEPILQTFNLSKRYKKRWAVRDLNLIVRRGEVFGFLGPNGAGKSTTIRMILSLVKPTAGRVELFGKALLRNRASVLKRVGGLVEAADFYLYLSARRNLEIVAALRGDHSSGDIDRVLDVVGLLGRASDAVKTYSHGMKQRLGIAQALLGNPELVVLDEPTSGLDPQGIKEVRELIQRLSQAGTITVFLSSHLLSEIEQTATSMAIINQGSLVVQGTVAELLASGPSVIRFDARPRDRALEILKASPLVNTATVVEPYIQCSVRREATAALTRDLVESGIAVHAIIPRRSLEEYFLSITEGASDVHAPDLSPSAGITGERRP